MHSTLGVGVARKRLEGMFGLKSERQGVHAVAKPGRRAESVLEDVAKVGAAGAAPYLCADHAKGFVLKEFDSIRIHRVVETGPPTTGIKLCAALEQLRATPCTGVETRTALVDQFACPSALRGGFSEYGEAVGVKLGTPLLFGLLDPAHCSINHSARRVGPTSM